MTSDIRQWDIVKVRVNPSDRDGHPAIIISPDEACADPRRQRINVLYGTTQRPGAPARPHETVLNGADGLDHATIFSCGHFFQISPATVSARLGCVGAERRRQIGRKIVATFRLPL